MITGSSSGESQKRQETIFGRIREKIGGIIRNL